MRHVSCILLLEWSTTSQRLWVYRISVPYAQKDPRFLFEKRRGQPLDFWSLVSTIDGMVVHYPRSVWKNCYAEHQVKSFHSLKWGMRTVLSCLEVGVQKVSDPRFSHFVAPPPPLPVINDQSLRSGNCRQSAMNLSNSR